jgi:hypothetical protein
MSLHLEGLTPASAKSAELPLATLDLDGVALGPVFRWDGLPNELCVRVDFDEVSNTACGGFSEVFVNGQWHDATSLYQCVTLPEVNGRVFGLEPATEYPVRVTFQRRDVTGETQWYVDAEGLVDSGLDIVEEVILEIDMTTAVDAPTLVFPRTKEVYVSDSAGSDANSGLSSSFPKATLAGALAVMVSGGCDLYYMGVNDWAIRSIAGAALSGLSTDWNRILPFDENAKIIGWEDFTGPWTSYGKGIWYADCTLAVGRVAHEADGWPGELLPWPCASLLGDDQTMFSDDPPNMALDAAAAYLHGDITGVVANTATSPDTYEITSAGHGLTTGDWVRISAVLADPPARTGNDLHRIHQITVLDANRFSVPSGNPTAICKYTSGGKWETQWLKGFHYDAVGEVLYVRLPDESEPTTLRVARTAGMLTIGSSGSAVQYLYANIVSELGGALQNAGPPTDYAQANSNNGMVRVINARHCILTGAFVQTGGFSFDVASPCSDILIDDMTAETHGPWDYFHGPDASIWQFNADDKFYYLSSGRILFHASHVSPPAVSAGATKNLAVRGAYIRGATTGVAGTNGGTRNVSVYNCDAAEGEDFVEFEEQVAVGLAVYHNSIDRMTSMQSLSPAMEGPFWHVANHGHDAYHRFWKIGDPGGDPDAAKAYIMLACNSYDNETQSETYDDCTQQFTGGAHSGVQAFNNVLVSYSAQAYPTLFVSGEGPADVGRVNWWEKTWFHSRALGWPLTCEATGHVFTLGTSSAGTYASTQTRDGTTHTTLAVVTNRELDHYYQFTCATPRNVTMVGRTASSTAPTNAAMYAWNWTTSSWDELLKLHPNTSSALFEIGVELTQDHSDPSTAEVRIRFHGSGGASSWGTLIDYIAINAPRIQWDGVFYETFSALSAAHEATDIKIVDATVTDTYPLNLDHTAISAIRFSGQYLPGVTNIASDGNGRLRQDIVGYFPAWSYEEETCPLATLDLSPFVIDATKSAVLGLSSMALSGFAAGSAKSGELPLGQLDLDPIDMAGELAPLPLAGLQLTVFPIGASKSAPLPLAAMSLFGLAPTASKSAELALGTIELVGLDLYEPQPPSSWSSASSSWSSWSSRSSWSSSFASSWSSSQGSSAVCFSYIIREDVEAVYGPENVVKWADLNNDLDESFIELRLEWAMCTATEMLNNRLRYGPYVIPFDSPYPLEVVKVVAGIAGVLLYESRGIADQNVDGNPIDVLSVHRNAAEDFVKDILAGILRLDMESRINVPGTVCGL